MTKQEKEQVLLKLWLNHKYWDSSCEDEAIDWSNHSNHSLNTVQEIADYVEWRAKLEKGCKEISCLVSRIKYQELSEIF